MNVIPASPGGDRGVIEIGQDGPDAIAQVLIGGQELGIDNIQNTSYGDANWDGIVNGLDVDPFVRLLISGDFRIVADMNHDGQVNGLDVEPLVAAVIGSSSGLRTIPEPSTLVLVIVGLIGFVASTLRLTSHCQ